MRWNARWMLPAGLALATLTGSAASPAVEYPLKPVRLVVSHVAGGAVDIFGRVLGQKLSEVWGQQIIVENRAGAAGSVGAQTVAKAAPDGYTLLLSTNAPLTTNPLLYKALGYDWQDFEPIIIAAEGQTSVIIHPALSVRTMPELLAYARQQSVEMTIGTSGNGSGGHFLIAGLRREYGIGFTHVPYKGGVPSVVAVSIGEVQAGFIDPGAAGPFIRNGRVRALAVTGSRRSSIVPEIPTMKELGVPGFENNSWVAFTAPKGTPKDIVDKINADVRRALKDPQIREKLINSGLEPAEGGSSREFAEFLRLDVPRWQQRVLDAGLKVE